MPQDIVVAKRTYTDKDGNEKTEWLNVGVFFEAKDGKKPYILLDATVNLAPLCKDGKLSVIASLFSREQGQQKSAQAQGQAGQQAAAATRPVTTNPASAPFDDEIPF